MEYVYSVIYFPYFNIQTYHEDLSLGFKLLHFFLRHLFLELRLSEFMISALLPSILSASLMSGTMSLLIFMFEILLTEAWIEIIYHLLQHLSFIVSISASSMIVRTPSISIALPVPNRSSWNRLSSLTSIYITSTSSREAYWLLFWLLPLGLWKEGPGYWGGSSYS